MSLNCCGELCCSPANDGIGAVGLMSVRWIAARRQARADLRQVRARAGVAVLTELVAGAQPDWPTTCCPAL